MKTKSGFTLVEILISLFIMAIMITAFSKLMSSTFKGMRTVSQSTELTTEAQLATPIMIERIQKAACIFKDGSVSIGTSILHKNTTGPGSPSAHWNIGTDPILAMFMAGSADGPDTYDFYAYYAIKRDKYMSTNQIGPQEDVQNDQSVWMILEYKHSIPSLTKPNCDGLINLKGGKRPRYVADFVAPSNDPLANPYTMFEFDEGTAADPRQSVTIRLRFMRNNGNRVEVLPSDGSLLSTKIYPRNVSYW